MYKIWRKFFLLALLSVMPVLSQAQLCIGSAGISTNPITIIPSPSGGWKVRASFDFIISRPVCTITPTQLSSVGRQSGLPTTFTANGVSVKISETKLTLAKSINCVLTGNNSNTLVFSQCTGSPQAFINIEYTLTGKSTATSPNTTLFDLQVTGCPDVNSPINFCSSSSNKPIQVPVSNAPTCNFVIDQPNIKLDTLKPSDIENLAAGTAVASVQKSFNITVNCAAGALSANANFAPQFSPTKSAVLSGNSHVALNDGTDNGVGFKLFDSSGAAMELNKPILSTNTIFAFTPTTPTRTKTFNIKYAKTSKAVTLGPVTSAITVTFSIL